MYKKILVAMSLEHGIGKSALNIAQKLLAENGEIFALHVHEALQGTAKAFIGDDAIKALQADAREELEKRVHGVPNAHAVLLSGHGARTLIDYAVENEIDCIVLGSHKPGLQDYFLGSTASRVVRHAHCAVHVVRNPV